jgi:hypothetical protein
MTVLQIEKACLKATQRAFDQHFRFSGGLPLGRAPEAFIQAAIAYGLAKTEPFITLESKVYNTLSDAGAELRGKPPRNSGGRIDLVTWWKSGKPRLLIEVKKMHGRESIAADVKRIRQVLRRGGSIREGLVVVYASAKTRKTLDSRMQHAAARTGAILGERSGAIPFDAFWSSSKWHYEVACFRVQT